jgi:hypothetical protein
MLIHAINNLLVTNPELEEDEQLRADMIEGETDAHEFLRVVERKRQEASALAGALASNIAELEERQKRFERREQAMRRLAFKVMEAADLKKIELAEATLSMRNGSRKVVISDDTAIPDSLCRIRKEPDRTAIKAMLESGAEVPGCVLSNGEPTISIRTR